MQRLQPCMPWNQLVQRLKILANSSQTLTKFFKPGTKFIQILRLSALLGSRPNWQLVGIYSQNHEKWLEANKLAKEGGHIHTQHDWCKKKAIHDVLILPR